MPNADAGPSPRALLGLLLGAAALVVFLWRPFTAGDAGLEMTAVVNGDRAAEGAPLPGLETGSLAAGTARRRAADRHAKEPGAVPVAVPVDGDTEPESSIGGGTIHGTAVLVGTDGVEHATPDGFLRVSFLRDQPPARVAVTAGTFELEWDGGRPLALRGAFLDGAEARLAERAEVGESAEEHQLSVEASPVRLEFQRIEPWTLHVVDAGTLQELRDVEVLQTYGWEAGVFCPDASFPSRVLARAADSPLVVPAGLGRQRYWVRAAGHAWRRMTVDHDVEHEVTVELEPAATLRVFCAPDDLSPLLEVRLYEGGFEGDDPAYSAAPITPGEATVFHDLPPGAYQVRVEAGEFFDPVLRFALEETDLAAGEVADVHLALDADLVGPSPAPLAGTLSLPVEALELGLELELELMRASGPELRPGDARRVRVFELAAAGEPGRFRFDFGPVTPGRVKLGLFPLRRSWVVDLPPAGDRRVHLECGAIERVEVEIRDALSAEKLPVEAVVWSPWPAGLWQVTDRPPGSAAEQHLMGQAVVHPDGATRVASFLAPVGDLHIGFWHEGYGEGGEQVRITQGRVNRFRFELEPRPMLLLGFVDPEGSPVSLAGWSVEPVGHESESELLRQEAGRYVITMEDGGAWRVVSAPRGWELAGDGDVLLTPGERTVFDVPVRPR